MKVILFLCFISWSFSVQADRKIDEYNMKTVLLYQIMRFVEWPESVEEDDNPMWKICVIGEDSFEGKLDKLIGKQILQRDIEIQRQISMEEIPDCQLLFIAASMQDELPELLAIAAEYPLLTLADTPNFALQGVMFNLVKKGTEDKQRIGIEINQKKTATAGFNIHARLLSLATLVECLP